VVVIEGVPVVEDVTVELGVLLDVRLLVPVLDGV